jgi:hypothetical protein
MSKERASSRHEESFKSWLWGTSPLHQISPAIQPRMLKSIYSHLADYRSSQCA